MAEYSKMLAGMTSTTIGILDSSISNPLPVIKVGGVSSIGPLAVQGAGNSFRFFMPAIENGTIKLIEIYYTFGSNLPLKNVAITVDILGY